MRLILHHSTRVNLRVRRCGKDSFRQIMKSLSPSNKGLQNNTQGVNTVQAERLQKLLHASTFTWWYKAQTETQSHSFCHSSPQITVLEHNTISKEKTYPKCTFFYCPNPHWFSVAQDRNEQSALVNSAIKHVANFLTTWVPISFSQRTLLHGVTQWDRVLTCLLGY